MRCLQRLHGPYTTLAQLRPYAHWNKPQKGAFLSGKGNWFLASFRLVRQSGGRMIKELLEKNRSFRRFYEDESVEAATLEALVDLTRLCASSANLQPLKYAISAKRETNARIFPFLKWAGYLKDWPGPSPGERPAAYIIVLGDRTISETSGSDHGIVPQTTLLGAVEAGLGGCIISNVDRGALVKELTIDERYEILMVISIRRPQE